MLAPVVQYVYTTATGAFRQAQYAGICTPNSSNSFFTLAMNRIFACNLAPRISPSQVMTSGLRSLASLMANLVLSSSDRLLGSYNFIPDHLKNSITEFCCLMYFFRFGPIHTPYLQCVYNTGVGTYCQ